MDCHQRTVSVSVSMITLSSSNCISVHNVFSLVFQIGRIRRSSRKCAKRNFRSRSLKTVPNHWGIWSTPVGPMTASRDHLLEVSNNYFILDSQRFHWNEKREIKQRSSARSKNEPLRLTEIVIWFILWYVSVSTEISLYDTYLIILINYPYAPWRTPLLTWNGEDTTSTIYYF